MIENDSPVKQNEGLGRRLQVLAVASTKQVPLSPNLKREFEERNK